ncbi:GNAT family N-acetyltransferase [Candidatus Sumerlaeota bacterium]
MSVFKNKWETARCLVLEAQERDLGTMTSVFADNVDAIRSQGADRQPERLASILLRHESLPPDGNPSQEQTSLIADKASNQTIGLLSFYRGYPTSKTLYIGSLFFRRDWQGRGLGREVTEELERRALQEGYEVAKVAVGLKNWPALRFWIALGFNRIAGITGDKESAEATYADIELTKNL